MQELINTSDSVSLKAYFGKIRELQKSGSKFPVSLDDVWPLVYAEKRNALRELEKSFIEGEDFNLVQNGKVVGINELKNGIKYDCYLSVSCLEYFIVRKVREVFNVYRTVFHNTVTAVEESFVVPQSFSEALLLAGRIQAEKEKLEAENAKLAPKAEYTDKVLASVTDITTTTIAKELDMSAVKLNKILCQEKVQYFHDGHYVLYSKYQSRGYTETRTYQWYDKSGVSHTKHSTVWTERGRAFVHSIVNQSLSFNKKKKEVSNG